MYNWAWLYVAFGGAIGATLRYLLSISLPFTGTFPWPTWWVNILGCFGAGLFLALSEKYTFLQAEWRLFLVVGVLGGFTTFSSFSLEVLLMLKQQLYLWAGLYVGSSLIVGLIMVLLGYMVIKVI